MHNITKLFRVRVVDEENHGLLEHNLPRTDTIVLEEEIFLPGEAVYDPTKFLC